MRHVHTPEEWKELIREGMEVFTRDDQFVGTVKKVWVEVHPPRQARLGVRVVEVPGPGEGYIRVERPGPDYYIPFTSILAVEPGRVVLAVDHEQLQMQGWESRPGFLPE